MSKSKIIIKMKKWVFGMIALFIALISANILASCEKQKKRHTTTMIDSAAVVSIIKQELSPKFFDFKSVSTYQLSKKADRSVDLMFEKMPQATLEQVVTVLLKKDGFATKESIVTEYNTFRSIYDNLKENGTPPDIIVSEQTDTTISYKNQ